MLVYRRVPFLNDKPMFFSCLVWYLVHLNFQGGIFCSSKLAQNCVAIGCFCQISKPVIHLRKPLIWKRPLTHSPFQAQPDRLLFNIFLFLRRDFPPHLSNLLVSLDVHEKNTSHLLVYQVTGPQSQSPNYLATGVSARRPGEVLSHNPQNADC